MLGLPRLRGCEKLVARDEKINMNKKIKDTPHAWDARRLGAEAHFVAVAGREHEVALNKTLGLPTHFDAQLKAVNAEHQPALIPERKAA
jgi:hypothetical protein